MDFLSWLPWIGGASTIGLIALAILAPSVLQVAAAWLTALSPVIKGIAEALVEFGRTLWAGLQDVIDNGKTIVFVVTLAVLAFAWGHQTGVSKSTRCSEVGYRQGESKVEKVKPPVRKPESNAFDDFLKNFGL